MTTIQDKENVKEDHNNSKDGSDQTTVPPRVQY
jgi:hypothetical protein